METILEQQRRLHEEKERLVDAMRKESLHSKATVSALISFFVFVSCSSAGVNNLHVAFDKNLYSRAHVIYIWQLWI